jgi:homoserine dehydrogenase
VQIIFNEKNIRKNQAEQTFGYSKKHMKKIGLIGYGCVGQGFVRYLAQQAALEFEIAGIAVKRNDIKRPFTIIPIHYNADRLIEDPSIDIIVEAIDDAEAAFLYATRALRNGKDVITANKKMVATHLTELLELQNETQRKLYFEAAVAGSIPILHLLQSYYRREPLTRLRGILNGTTNYVLTKIFNEKLDYRKALRQAQKLGFAESEPSSDVTGADAWYKSKLLAYRAFGVDLDLAEIMYYGIDTLHEDDIRYARSRQKRIKLIPIIQPTSEGIVAWVLPHLVDPSDSFFTIDNEFNCIELEGGFIGRQQLIGKGAGSLPTAAALVGDLNALETRNKQNVHSQKAGDPAQIQIEVYIRDHEILSQNTIPFEEVKEGYMDDSYHYLVGFIDLKKLIALKPWLYQRRCTVIATGQYKINTKSAATHHQETAYCATNQKAWA